MIRIRRAKIRHEEEYKEKRVKEKERKKIVVE